MLPFVLRPFAVCHIATIVKLSREFKKCAKRTPQTQLKLSVSSSPARRGQTRGKRRHVVMWYICIYRLETLQVPGDQSIVFRVPQVYLVFLIFPG